MRSLVFALSFVLFTAPLATANNELIKAAIERHVREALRQKSPVDNYHRPIVPNAHVAIAIHCAVTREIYGKDNHDKPYHAVRSGPFWVVYGELPRGYFGTVAVTVIRASNGEIVSVSAGFR